MTGATVRALAAVAIGVAGASFGLTGFVLGRESAREPRIAPAARDGGATTTIAARIAVELLELPLPVDDSDGASWRAAAEATASVCARHGLDLDPNDEARSLVELRGAGAAAETAALLDLRAALEHFGGRSEVSGGFTRLARALDPDPVRDSIRAPLLAGDREAVQLLAADLVSSTLPLSTATLLGAALLRVGHVDDALDAWSAASVEHPDAVTLHVLLGWRLLATDPPRTDEALRHLHAARALVPESAAVRERLAAAGR